MSLNKAMLIGRLGKDPEVRKTQSGASVTNFSVATDESFKDKAGNRQQKTEWHNVVAWGKLATFAQEYLKKGREVYVEGSIQNKDWEKDGVKHYKTEINAHTIRFVGPKSASDVGPSGQQQDGKDDPNLTDDTMEDDIPF